MQQRHPKRGNLAVYSTESLASIAANSERACQVWKFKPLALEEIPSGGFKEAAYYKYAEG